MNTNEQTREDTQAAARDSLQSAVHQMQRDLVVTGTVQAQHLVRVLGDPGVGVSLKLPVGATAQSCAMKADSPSWFTAKMY